MRLPARQLRPYPWTDQASTTAGILGTTLPSIYDAQRLLVLGAAFGRSTGLLR